MARPTTTISRSARRAASATALMRATLEAKVVTATRRGAFTISSVKRPGDVGLRRRAALADRIGGIADQHVAALGAERPQLGLVGRRTQHRRRIELPVAGVQHVAVGRAQNQRVGFRDRMRDRDKLDVERPDVEARAERHLGDRDFRHAVFALALGFEQRRGERRRIDRHLELRPEVEHRAVVVLVGVGEHDAGDVAALLDQIADVRETPGRCPAGSPPGRTTRRHRR